MYNLTIERDWQEAPAPHLHVGGLKVFRALPFIPNRPVILTSCCFMRNSVIPLLLFTAHRTCAPVGVSVVGVLPFMPPKYAAVSVPQLYGQVRQPTAGFV
jgi:hypothetical protein